MPSPDRSAQAWSLWISRLSERAQRAITAAPPIAVPDDETVAYADWRRSLSDVSRASLEADADEAEAPNAATVDDKDCHFYLVEAPDGDMPVLRKFRTVEAMARYIGKMEGEDISVWPFYGVPLTLTQGPGRYLALPDGISALNVPAGGTGTVRRIDLDLLNEPIIQQDGYLGPAALAGTTRGNPQPDAVKRDSARERDDDEEDPDDDHAAAV